MIRALLILSLVFFFQSCDKGLFNGDIRENLKAMDKIHGKCNNPYREYSKRDKLKYIAKTIKYLNEQKKNIEKRSLSYKRQTIS